jgi:hypothetical protein
VLSFVGVAPMDDPKFVMLVMLDEPKNEKWGSEAAAPIFSAIGKEILRYMEIPPRDAQPVQLMAAERAAEGREPVSQAPPVPTSDAGARMPDLRGKPLRQALATLAALKTDVQLEGNGFVVRQTPVAGAALSSDEPVRLVLAKRGEGKH